MPSVGSTESLVKAVSPAAGGVEAQRRAFYEGHCVNGTICLLRRGTRLLFERPFSRRRAPINARHVRAQAVSRPRSGECNERSLDTAEHARILTDGASRPSLGP